MERGTGTSSGAIQPFPALGTTVGYNNGGGDHLLGAVDDMRIWSVARTPGEIAAAATP